MKTATIRVNHVHGSKNEFCADVFYRGKLLYSCLGTVPNKLLCQAQKWAKTANFTHINASLG